MTKFNVLWKVMVFKWRNPTNKVQQIIIENGFSCSEMPAGRWRSSNSNDKRLHGALAARRLNDIVILVGKHAGAGILVKGYF